MKTLTTFLALLFTGTALAQEEYVPPEPPVVQEVHCAGNTHTSCNFIRDHLYLGNGDALDEEEIRNAELRLSALRNFESARIRLEKGSQRGEVVIVIDVVEASAIALESIAGLSSREDSVRAVLGGRIANQNLFGTGKYVDVSVVAVMPVTGDVGPESYEINVRYADPHLFDSRRWFAMASAGYRKAEFRDEYGNFTSAKFPQLSASLGIRFADYSYFMMGYANRPDLDWHFGQWKNDGSFLIDQPEGYSSTINLIYGWSSEDDLHFPTRGSTFQAAVGGDYGSKSPNRRSHIQFRKTWDLWNAYWTFRAGGDPSPEYRNAFSESQLVSLTYARPLVGGDEVKRGRWYIEPGINGAAYSAGGVRVLVTALKVGWRAETRSFGIVDLYLLGSVDASW